MSCAGKASQHDSDHCHPDEGSDGAGGSKSRAKRRLRLIQARVRSTIQRLGRTNTQRPVLATARAARGPWLSGIGEDALDEGKKAAGASIENQSRAVAVLNVGGMNDNVQQEAERIDKDVALAPGDLLARVKPLRVKHGAPFWAPLALWLSMIAAVGLTSRPSRSRVST
jgi:hypothetical protein